MAVGLWPLRPGSLSGAGVSASIGPSLLRCGVEPIFNYLVYFAFLRAVAASSSYGIQPGPCEREAAMAPRNAKGRLWTAVTRFHFPVESRVSALYRPLELS